MMVMVFRLVFTTFCSWFPSASDPQTKTMAVQGLEPRRMRLTMSWSWPARKYLARSTVTMGATTQLLNMVSMMGFGFSMRLRSSDSWRFRRAGYIMRKRQMPMGTLMPLTCQALRAVLIPGTVWLRTRPRAMHAATHPARYFSNVPRLFSSGMVIHFPCIRRDIKLDSVSGCPGVFQGRPGRLPMP